MTMYRKPRGSRGRGVPFTNAERDACREVVALMRAARRALRRARLTDLSFVERGERVLLRCRPVKP